MAGCKCKCVGATSSKGSKGDKGANGADGVPGAAGTIGTTVLYNTTTPSATNNAAMSILQSYTLPINTLMTNGDALELTAIFDTNLSLESKSADLRIGGTVSNSKISEFELAPTELTMKIIAIITRQSATTLYIDFHSFNANGKYKTEGNGTLFYETGFSVSSLLLNTTLLEIRGRNMSGGTELLNCTQLIVKYLKKP